MFDFQLEYMKFIPAFLWILCLLNCSPSSSSVADTPISDKEQSIAQKRLELGIERTSLYLPYLKNKKIALVVNQSSILKKMHLVDSLIKLGINIEKIFAPEHGFRGKADAGEKIQDSKDELTGITIKSLYGSNKKPKPKDLENIDCILFDLQDVGVRFYTYISTLHYIMESCAENNIQLVVLDRPNPNGHYVDGPVLEAKHKSFVGMHSVPVVHGMTIGEYAKMIDGEYWLKDSAQCNPKIIKCANYNRNKPYSLSIAPSPNLKSDQAIALYPSLCFFEGTDISVGRGTEDPFTIYGHPSFNMDYSFTPIPREGAKHPKHNKKQCFGVDLKAFPTPMNQLNIDWLIEAYRLYEPKEEFFNNFFNLLAGTSKLKSQIKEGLNAEEIRSSWKEDLELFQKVRAKYLCYPDKTNKP